MKKIVVFLVAFIIGSGIHAQETYTLSPESTLTIDGTSTLRDWSTTANTLKGSLVTQAGTPKEILLEVPVADIKSERGATMDKKTFNALKGTEHPMVTFMLTDFGDNNMIMGTLSVAGVEKEVSVTSSITAEGSSFILSGEYTITLEEYNMEPPSAMFGQIVVGEDVVVHFNLVFTK
ncbi:MAG: YceI family protein [Bacteroidota bacterium]